MVYAAQYADLVWRALTRLRSAMPRPPAAKGAGRRVTVGTSPHAGGRGPILWVTGVVDGPSNVRGGSECGGIQEPPCLALDY
jgi:hypothetical protein